MDTDPITQALFTQELAMKAAENIIVAVLQTCEKPLTLIRIADRAKCKNDRNFATALQQLCESGRIIHCPSHAYWLASREPAPSVVRVKPALRRPPPR